ncbi:unnamed protein product [Urochloa humidicola]
MEHSKHLNQSNIPIKHLQHACETCNIQIYFCNIQMKQLQYSSKTSATRETYTCNMQQNLTEEEQCTGGWRREEEPPTRPGRSELPDHGRGMKLLLREAPPPPPPPPGVARDSLQQGGHGRRRRHAAREGTGSGAAGTGGGGAGEPSMS